MAGVNKFLKYSMFVFNFLFWICGSIILGISIWIRVSLDKEEYNQQNGLSYAVNVLIAVGAIIMVLGFFGCCGAVKESRCLLLLFFIGLLLIFALQITGGILGAVYKSELEETLKQSFQLFVPIDRLPKKAQEGFEILQKENNCCGLIKGIQDWGSARPKSCECPKNSDPNLCIGNFYKTTCASALLDIEKKNFSIIIGIAFGMAVVELIGLAFSMTLYCQIKNK